MLNYLSIDIYVYGTTLKLSVVMSYQILKVEFLQKRFPKFWPLMCTFINWKTIQKYKQNINEDICRLTFLHLN